MAFVVQKIPLRNGDVTFNISQVSRIPGSKTRQKKVSVEKYRRSELVREGRDPEEFIEERLRALREEAAADTKTISYKVDLSRRLELSGDGNLGASSLVLNLGYAAYSKLYHMLELDYLVNARRKHVKAKYNMNVLFQHLVYSRLLWPDSKLGTWEDRNRFYGGTDYRLSDVYRCMDNILEWREDILRQMDRSIRRTFGRKGTVIFYDVTNYYFELDREDGEDGLRARGASKEHRPEPIVQMGLFMDELGLPITYELFRGNTNDSITMPGAMDSSIIDFTDSRKIVVADKGMMSYYNILKIRQERNGYVISQSVRKADRDTKAFALSDEGWTVTRDSEGDVVYRIKERIVPRRASAYGDVDSSRHSGTYNERQVFIWSRKYSQRARYDRKKAIEDAKDCLGTRPRDFKDSDYGKNRYLVKKAVKGNETIEHDRCVYEFDSRQLEEDEMYDGYYIICTNVLGVENEGDIRKDRPENWAYYRESDGFLVMNHIVPASEIAEIYGGLWKIEETFKVTKTAMINLRPVFHSLQDRIRAHFLICFVSLVLERLLEYKLEWKYSSRSLQKSLSSFNAVNLADSNIYQVSYYDSIIKDVVETMELGITEQFLRQSDIRKIMGQTKKID